MIRALFNYRAGFLALTVSFGLMRAVAQPYTFNVSVGADFPELVNLGLRYEWSKYQFGVAYGSVLAEEDVQTLTTDFWYHFMGSAEADGRKPGYLRGVLNLLRADNGTRLDKDVYIGFRIGRVLMFTERAGLRADAGFSFLAGTRSILKSTGKVIDLSVDSYPIIPGFGLAVFYKF